MDETPLLKERFARLLRREKTRRRERVLVMSLFYSLVISLLVFPVRELLPSWISPLAFPPLLFLPLVPLLFLLHPWERNEAVRAVARLDRALNLEERAVTSWEIVGREEKRAEEMLVLNEAAERLSDVDPGNLFERRYPWQALWTPPLLALWLLFLWFDVAIHPVRAAHGLRPATLAQRLKDFSTDLKQRAKSQGLDESLKVAQALEESADKGLRGEMAEKDLHEDITAMADRIEQMGSAAAAELDLALSASTRERLLDLKAELEALKPLLPTSGLSQEGRLTPEIQRRLETLPRLSEELGRRLRPSERAAAKDLDRWLSELEKSLASELDRRTLRETKEFLDLLAQGEREEGQQSVGLREDRGELSLGEKEKAQGSSAGKEPGSKEHALARLPSKGISPAQLEGLLGEGKSDSLVIRGGSLSKKSRATEEEILISYRRQVEEDLASERIPEGLRQTIRNYFLSLGMGGEKK